MSLVHCFKRHLSIIPRLFYFLFIWPNLGVLWKVVVWHIISTGHSAGSVDISVESGGQKTTT